MAEQDSYILVDDLTAPQRLAFYRCGQLAEIWVSSTADELGSVHYARVTAVHKQHRRAAGQLADGTNISWQTRPGIPVPAVGALTLVTLTAFGWQGKPVQASSGIQLAGHFCLLSQSHKTPGTVRLSKKSTGSSGTAHPLLAALCRTGLPARLQEAGLDLVIRRRATAATAAGDSEAVASLVRQEADFLIADFIQHSGTPVRVSAIGTPGCLYPGLPLVEQAKLYARCGAVRLAAATDFEEIKDQLARHLGSRYDSPCGAVIWFEPTRAATMIDVDSAGSHLGPAQLGRLILPEIFAALRLRGIAGRVLIDLPYSGRAEQKQQAALIEGLADDDPRAPEYCGFSASGLIELRLRYARHSLDMAAQRL